MTAEHRVDRIILSLGLILSVIGFGWLIGIVATQNGQLREISSGIYGVALVLMFACATAYHWRPNDRPRTMLRIVDHSAIYVLIAGTYTPFTLPNVQAEWARVALVLMWALVCVGIVFKLLWIGRADRLSLIFYLVMGWSAIMFIRPLSEALPSPVLRPLILGGVLYSVGALIYARKHLPYRLPIWHAFVIAGGSTHYVAVFRYLVT